MAYTAYKGDKMSPMKQVRITSKQRKTAEHWGDVRGLNQKQLNKLPSHFFDNPHGLGPGGGKRHIENLNADKYDKFKNPGKDYDWDTDPDRLRNDQKIKINI